MSNIDRDTFLLIQFFILAWSALMPKRTNPKDAVQIEEAADLEEIVNDKRAEWRATGAKARRRQRRYKALLVQQLIKDGGDMDGHDTR